MAEEDQTVVMKEKEDVAEDSISTLMEDTVITTEKSSEPFDALTANKIICRVCQKQFSQYTCPRCNLRYCSLQCYKGHSLQCTESFMRENVMAELNQTQPDDNSKQKMLDILKRFHSEEESIEGMDHSDNDDNDDHTLSEETVQKILSGNQVSLDDLSPEEVQQFQRAVASGELSKLIKPWNPWWFNLSAKIISFSREGTQLVKPLQQQALPLHDTLEGGQSTEVPPGPENPLPPINKLSSTNPSPLLSVHLIDIIYSYCFTLRLYNGDWKSDAFDAATVVLSLSSVFGEGVQPESVAEALAHSMKQTCSASYKHAGGLQFGVGLIDDAVTLLHLGRNALVCALCDLQRLIQAGGHELRSESLRKLKKSVMKTKLKLVDRKIYFMMCWVYGQPKEAWTSLATLVEMEKGTMADIYSGDRNKPVNINISGEKESKNKDLIKEVK
ncbi:zinc finger HIT domain-containing protein 2-like [Papaver somniferum]|uniref:zinc finger HIT domain-containing protein 2-like n=1 Tax=Papaver somniferum TaxID=3469 RepID=UPI000E6F7266|nr:zinc finger HIT domain-containing protein 2-like [Papaver somniferum]